MKTEIREAWQDALLSGLYNQTRGTLSLKDENGYCCLGVLCEVGIERGMPIVRYLDNEANDYWSYRAEFEDDGAAGTLTPGLLELFDLEDKVQMQLAEWNDDGEERVTNEGEANERYELSPPLTFEEIAERLEEMVE
jgi:hypothetical protein